MAKLALTLGGAIIGFAIGGPFGAQIGAMIGGMVGNLLFAPTIKGPRLTDLTVTASTYGQVIPRLYGTMRLGGNLIWTTGIQEHKKKTGGKGGPKQVNYTYTASFAIAFCEGEIDGMTRFWADGKLIAGSDPKSSQSVEILAMEAILGLTKKKTKFKYRIYKGDETQEADSTILAKEGAGGAPGYRGLAYVVFVDMPLEDFGNRIPQITAEVSRKVQPSAPWVQLASDEVNYEQPNNWSSRGDVDWENSKFFKYSDGYVITYDLRTMQELYRVALDVTQDGYLPSYNPAFSIGGKYFFANVFSGNSGPANIWDTASGVDICRIGHYSTSFPADPQPDHDHPFTPSGALIGSFDGQAMWFRVPTTLGQMDVLYHAGNLGQRALMWTPEGQPVHWLDFSSGGSFDGAFTWTPMRGRENEATLIEMGSADMLFLRSSHGPDGWDTYLKIVNIIEGAVMFHKGGPPFGTVNNPFNTETPAILLPRPFADVDFSMVNCAYDKSDNGIVIWGAYGGDQFNNGSNWCMAKYLIDEGEYKWAMKDTDLDPSLGMVGTGGAVYSPADVLGYPVELATQSNLEGGNVGWVRRTYLYLEPTISIVDLNTGKVSLAKLDSPLGAYQETAFAMNAWDDVTQSIMGAPERIFVANTGNGMSLQAIVDDIMTKTGSLTPGQDWDSSELAGITVRGYTIAREASAKDCLGQLGGAYFFDGVESDYIVKFKLRGGDPVATITEKHMGFVADRDISLKETRAQELELPMRVSITYSDFDRDYQDGTQSAKRNTDPFPTMHSHNEVKFELPIAMTATDSKRIADKSLKMAWSNRWNYSMKLPWEFLKYDPTDVINVATDEGNVYQMRIDKMDLGVDFTIDTSASSEKPAAYVSSVVGDPGSGVPIQQINVGGPCDFFMINSPMLRDADDTQGAISAYYVSAKAKSPGDFIAAYVFKATDASATEFESIDVVGTEPTWGLVTSALPDHYDYGVDTKTVLTVRIMSFGADLTPDILESITYDELLGGTKNAAIVGDEVIQFQTATPLGNGLYQLTNILRARRGTNYATQGHSAGERFILLTMDGSVLKEFNDASEWERTHYFKAVATGSYSEDALTVAVPMEPNDLRPYTPEYIRAVDDGTNITIKFERRSRISNELTDGSPDVPYKEGQGSLAHFVYKVYANKVLSDTPWEDGTVPTFTGNVAIYSGVSFAPLTFQFAQAGLSSFVLELYEVGYVDGFKKLVQFVHVSGTEWDRTELY